MLVPPPAPDDDPRRHAAGRHAAAPGADRRRRPRGLLLALPGVLAAVAAEAGRPAEVVLTAALAATSLGLASWPRPGGAIPQYLPCATRRHRRRAARRRRRRPAHRRADRGVRGRGGPARRHRRAAARAHPDPATGPSVRRWSVRSRRSGPAPPRHRGQYALAGRPAHRGRASPWPPSPARWPSSRSLRRWPPRWSTRGDAEPALAGPAGVLLHPPSTSTAQRARGRAADRRRRPGRRRLPAAPPEAVPVVLPGMAVTLLIAPIALRMPWPASTMARAGRLHHLHARPGADPAAAGHGRADRCASPGAWCSSSGSRPAAPGWPAASPPQPLTLFTLGSAVGVGLAAALGGRTPNARILGWLFAAVMAQLFVLTAGLVAGLEPAVVGVRRARRRRGAAHRRGDAAAAGPARGDRARRPRSSGAGTPPRCSRSRWPSTRRDTSPALLAAWGAVLGVAATRPGRRPASGGSCSGRRWASRSSPGG